MEIELMREVSRELGNDSRLYVFALTVSHEDESTTTARWERRGEQTRERERSAVVPNKTNVIELKFTEDTLAGHNGCGVTSPAYFYAPAKRDLAFVSCCEVQTIQ